MMILIGMICALYFSLGLNLSLTFYTFRKTLKENGIKVSYQLLGSMVLFWPILIFAYLIKVSKKFIPEIKD